jgi:outer membrane protein assembly factor BamE (lipoprotein component of BamABCDE complex)
MRYIGRWTATILCAAVLVSVGSGCLVSSDTKQTRSGNFVPENTFDQIKPKQTTQAWVKAVLGEPSSKANADNSEIWKWSYTERKESSGAIFLIFGGHDEKEQTHTAYVEFKDGVVVNKWRG